MTDVIFVFGSNRAGIHGAAAARYAAEKEGAVFGFGEGEKGTSYALPTKDENIQTLPLDEIEKHIVKFLDHARANPWKLYKLTPVGCGLANLKRSDIIKIVFKYDVPENVLFTRDWFKTYRY